MNMNWRALLAVSLREMMHFSYDIVPFILESISAPLLYLLAFGWMVGRKVMLGDVNYLHFMFPGIIAITIMNASYFRVSMSLLLSRLNDKTIDEFLVAPMSPATLESGHCVTGIVRGVMAFTMLLVVGLLFGVRIHIGAWFILTLIVTCLLFASVGVIVGMTARSHQVHAAFSTVVLLPVSFLSGTVFPIDTLPEAVRYILMLSPLTHTSLCLRASALGYQFPYGSLIILTAVALLLFYLAVMSIKLQSRKR